MTLRELRESSKITRAAVARALGVVISAVSNHENGIRKVTIEQVLILSKLYDCTAEEVIQAQLKSVAIRNTN